MQGGGRWNPEYKKYNKETGIAMISLYQVNRKLENATLGI